MNIAVLLSSGRKKGNTYRAASLMAAEMKVLGEKDNLPVEFHYIQLPEKDIKHCLGCRTCLDVNEERCPLRDDDIKSIRSLLVQSDGIIATSPVYINDVAGVMKDFLDRMAYACYRSDLSDKCAYILTTTGSASMGHTLKTISGAFFAYGSYLSGKMGLITGAEMTDEEMCQKHGKRIQKAAGSLYTDIRDKKYMKPSFISLMIFNIRKNMWIRAEDHSGNKIFWKERGWLDSGASYYFPHQAPKLKVFFAQLLSGLLLLFLKKT